MYNVYCIIYTNKHHHSGVSEVTSTTTPADTTTTTPADTTTTTPAETTTTEPMNTSSTPEMTSTTTATTTNPTDDTSTPVANCTLKAVPGRPYFYMLGGLVRPCAPGTIYSQFHCTCVHDIARK